MRIYTVHVRPGGLPDDPDVVLVKEGFCWPALFLPVVWALYYRLWLGLLGYLAAAAAVGGLAALLGQTVEAAVSAAFALLVAWLANDVRRWTLERRGYRGAGVVNGKGLAEAEWRLFHAWAADPLSRPADVGSGLLAGR